MKMKLPSKKKKKMKKDGKPKMDSIM